MGAECEAEHGAEAVLGVGVLWWDTRPYPCPCPLTSRRVLHQPGGQMLWEAISANEGIIWGWEGR